MKLSHAGCSCESSRKPRTQPTAMYQLNYIVVVVVAVVVVVLVVVVLGSAASLLLM